MKLAIVFAILFLMAAILFLWIIRIEVKPMSDTSFTVTDHWTESVYWCDIKGGCLQLYPQNPK